MDIKKVIKMDIKKVIELCKRTINISTQSKHTEYGQIVSICPFCFAEEEIDGTMDDLKHQDYCNYLKAKELLKEADGYANPKKDIVRESCIAIIKNIVGDFELTDTTSDVLDMLDFVEIVMEIEKQFKCSIDDTVQDEFSFETINDLVNWATEQVKKQTKTNLQKLCKRIMHLDHIAVQCDHLLACEEMHQTIKEVDKLDKNEAVRLLMHVIHVQQLQLAGAEIKYSEDTPFKDMVEFTGIETSVRSYSPNKETLL